jgi:hydrogenase nickel incorporation protein HypA/HybF
MHELSLASEAVEIVIDHLECYPGATAESITLSIGKFSAIDPEALEFCFPFATEGTPLENAKINIELVPLKINCSDCSAKGVIAESLQCPICGSVRITVIEGRDMLISSIELNMPDEKNDQVK